MVGWRVWWENRKGENKKLHFYHGKDRNELKGIPCGMIGENTEGK